MALPSTGAVFVKGVKHTANWRQQYTFDPACVWLRLNRNTNTRHEIKSEYVLTCQDGPGSCRARASLAAKLAVVPDSETTVYYRIRSYAL